MALNDPIRFRDTLLAIIPKWLKLGVGGALMYAFGLMHDLLGDAAGEAVKRRFPGYEAYDSLNIIGKDRRIRRGAFETEANFAARLPQWLVDHSNRGGPYALLRQVFGFYSSNPFDVELRYHSGRKFDMDTAGDIVRGDTIWVPPADTDWATWFLIYQWPGAVNDDGDWDDPGTWDDGGIWDSDITSAERDEIIQVPSEWRAAHARGFVVLQNGGNEAVMEVP